MPRPSKPHLNKGYWRVRIDKVEHHLGKDRRQAMRKFHSLMKQKYPDVPDDQPRTINGAVGAWLRLKPSEWNDWRLRDFSNYAGRVALDDVTADLLTRYALYLSNERKLAPKTVIDRVRTAAAVLRWTVDQEWVDRMPKVPKLKKPVHQPRDIDPDILDDVLGRLPKRAGRVLRFIAATGCRPSEACRLEWRHVHLDAGVCILAEHKTASSTGKPRTIYLTPDAATILRKMRPSPGPVFTNRGAEPYRASGLRSIFRRASEKVLGRGNELTPYQLRHTFAQTVSEQVPRDVLSKLLGHSDEATARFYYEVRDRRAVQAAKTLKLRCAAS